MQNNNKSQADKDKNFWLNVGLRMFAESTGWIAIPVVVALYLGRYLDERQSTGNLYFFGLTALAFIISCIGLGVIGVKYLKMLDQDKEQKKDNESKQ